MLRCLAEPAGDADGADANSRRRQDDPQEGRKDVSAITPRLPLMISAMRFTGTAIYTALEQRWDARVSRQLLSSGPAQLCDARVGRKTFAVESDAELWRFADRLRTRFAKANVPSLLI